VDNFIGRIEAKGGWIANVEADDFVALAFEFERFFRCVSRSLFSISIPGFSIPQK
jgi:hypothetical protein